MIETEVNRRGVLLGAAGLAAVGCGARAAEGGAMEKALAPLVAKGEVTGLVAVVDR